MQSLEFLASRRNFRLAALGCWLLCCLWLLAWGASSISGLDLRDPDDAMRLVEVRDFLAGQNWFDVSQHRVNPPIGGPMHWSRLVDLPIALPILLLKPLLGQAMAERIALVLVPLATLGLLFAAFALAVRRIAGPVVAIASLLLLAMAMGILIQFTVLRIDHHGWQICMAAITLWASFDSSARRGGLIAGAATALWLHISSEGLPYAALFGALYAIGFIVRATDWWRLLNYLLMLSAGSAGLLLAVHGWPAAAVSYCDAMSPAYLLPLIAASGLLLAAGWLIPQERPVVRFAIIAVAGVGSAATFLVTGRSCLAGPFAMLDPFVYRYWYLHVMEGRPIWDQDASTIATTLVPPIFGLAATLLAIRHATARADREKWVRLLFLALGAFAVSLTVFRGMSVSHLFALPGTAWLLLRLLAHARAIRGFLPRVLATCALVLLMPPSLSLEAMEVTDLFENTPEALSGNAENHLSGCIRQRNLRGLAQLPSGIVFAPLDISPNILAFTPHSVIGTGHHRNRIGMAYVIRAFVGHESQAREILHRVHARYLAFCPGMNEVKLYTAHDRHSFMGDLVSGPIPSWLHPVTMRPGETIRVYRVE